jgi:hypothetical protein
MRNKRTPPSVLRARRTPMRGQGTPRIFKFGETVTAPPVLPNDGTCNPASALRFNGRLTLRSWPRGARR